MEITGIAAGGDGVGHLDDGMAVFVPRTAPGDLADVEIVERKRRYARARLMSLASAGRDRTEPRCLHYMRDRCGGCQLQHLSAEAQTDWKARIVGDALRRIAGLQAGDPTVVPSPAAWRYRTRITLAVKDGRIGFRTVDQPDHVFQLEDCLIARESLMQVWGRLNRVRDRLPEGTAAVELREDRDGRVHVVVRGGAAAQRFDGAALGGALGDGVALWWAPTGHRPRPVGAGDPAGPAPAFEQVNPGLAARLRVDAVEALNVPRAGRVWDLYGGVGETARLMAAAGADVWSVDADRAAIHRARSSEHEGERRSGGAIRYLARRAEDAVRALPEPERVVVNPPRGGLGASVAARLDAWGGSRRDARLVYVSCDPATLARDLTRLGAFSLAAVRAYDLFPQTSHVETLAVLEAA